MANHYKDNLVQTQTKAYDIDPTTHRRASHVRHVELTDDHTGLPHYTPTTETDTSEMQNHDEETTTTEDNTPVGNFMFCDNLKKLVPVKSKPFTAIRLEDSNPYLYTRFTQPLTTNAQTFHRGHMPGRITVSSMFHMESNREKRNLEDEGLDDADLTAADGIIRTKKEKISKRQTIAAVDTVKITKGEFVFPHRTYKPKCQIAFRVAPGQVPQAVMAERLHRIYKKMDINIVLQTLGVELSDLIPPCNYGENNERFYEEMMFRNRIKINGIDKREALARGTSLKNGIEEGDEELRSSRLPKGDSNSSISSSQTVSATADRESFTSNEERENEEMPGEGRGNKPSVHPFIQSKPPFSPQFPLSYFDNTEYDIRSGEDWCRLGWEDKEKRFYPLPAKAFLPLPLPAEKKVNLKAPSELTMDEILRKTPRLEGFRQWLLRERFDRQIRLIGLEPSKVTRLSPSELEMKIVARLGSTVATRATFSDDSLQELHKAKRLTKSKSLNVDEDMSMTAREDGSDEDSDEYNSYSEHEGESENEVKDEELLNIVYKLRQPRRDEDDSDEDDIKALTANEDAKKSESLLSDVFSDLDTMTMLGSDLMANIQRALGMEVEETDADDMDEDSERQDGKVVRGLSRPARSYFMGDYGINVPDSPDIDPFEDDMEQYVIDFDKMKKVHIYDWRWVDVAVFDYHPIQNKYFVRSIGPYGKGYVYAWVSKIYLMFDAEDPNKHGLRIKDAVKRRMEMENVMRYNLYIDCLPMVDFPDLEEYVMERIVLKAISASNIKLTDHAMRKVQREINLEYQRTIAEEKFQTICYRHHKTFHPWVQFPDKSEAYINTVIPGYDELGKSDGDIFATTSTQNFEFKTNSIQKATVIYTHEGWKPYNEIINICLIAKEQTLILTEGLVPMNLDDWSKMQIENMAEVKRYLEDWYEVVVTSLKTNFAKTNKSWYNLAEKNYDVFLISKMFNFLQLIKIVMQDTLRSIITDSCTRLRQQIQDYSNNIDPGTDWSWGDDLLISEYPPPPDFEPLWIVEMHLDLVEGPRYVTPLHSFYQHASILYYKAVRSCSKKPTLLSKVMPQMQFAAIGFLHAVDENEIEIMEIGYDIVKFTKLILIPLESYIRKFQKYKDIWSMDIGAYVKKLEEANPTAADIKKVVEQNKRHMQRLEREIPVQIEITAFKVIVEHVRDTILAKKKLLITSILDGYASKLRRIIEKVQNEYAEMEKKLTLRSDDIEEVVELKGYVDIVPSLVTRLDVITNAVIKDYEVFDHFMYSIPDEDVNEKWQAALNSNRILKLGRDATKWLEEDYERLLKVQQADLSTLSDQVDSATLTVAGLAAFIELEKASMVCQEIKRIWKLINELQDQSNLLNKRQKVFGLPPAATEALHRLSKDIEPFKNLWFTAADWLAVQESLSAGILENIDLTEVQRVISDGGKVIGRSIKFFAGADQIQQIARLIKSQLEEFRPLVPLIHTLKKPELRPRHWDAITEVCGFNVMEKTGENLLQILETSSVVFVPEVVAIGDLASKEYEVEYAMEKMATGIAKFEVKLDYHEQYKLYHVKLTSALVNTIREYINITVQLVANPYNKPFQEQLGIWDKKIKLSRVSVEKWLDLQTRWFQMQPTFIAPDAPTKMPVTYKLYLKVKRIWGRLTRLARSTSEILELASNSTTIASLQQFATHLGSLQQSLAEFLRPKGSDSDED